MKVPLVTISRQYGTNARRVAALVAEQLGVPLYDREILTQAAGLAHVEEEGIADAERHHGVRERLLEGRGRVSGMSAATLPLPDTVPPPLVYSSADFRV